MKSYLVLAAILCANAAQGLLMPGRERPKNSRFEEDMLAIFGTPEEVTEKIKGPQGCGLKGMRLMDRLERPLGVEKAEYAEFSWTVAVFNKYNNTYMCAGSLIHPSVVLTVGHWFKAPGSWRVRAGEWKLSDTSEIFDHQDRDVKEVVTHPRMDMEKYNIALLFLDKPIELKPHISFVCLPALNAVTHPGTSCVASAWGHEKKIGGQVQDIMKSVEMPIVERTDCTNRVHQKVPRSSRFRVHDTVLCAGGEEGVDMCYRDGGGPLVCPYTDDNGRYYQAGIVSGGFNCGLRLPGFYTDVVYFRSWIDLNVVKRGFTTDTYTPPKE